MLAQFLGELERLLGPRGLTRDPALMEPWLTDWRGRYSGRALALASPGSTAEVAAVVTLCARHGVPIVPQGGNSSMSGGATPDASGTALLLSLRRLDAIGPVEGSQVRCGAGVILQNLHDTAERHGQRFPLTLGGKGSATIGGLIATNAGGTQVLRHGTMRDQVLGIEAVLADGSVIDLMTALRKDNRGFDLKQLLIGSEGTLGIVTAATLRLRPKVAGRCVLWAAMDTVHDARKLLLLAQERVGAALEGFEILPQHCLAAVLDYLPSARAPLAQPSAWQALIELVADNEPAAARLPDLAQDLLGEALADGLISDATIAASETQAEALWQLRDTISPAERAVGPAMQHDIAVPVAAMADFIAAAIPAVEARFPGTTALAFGHLGDGNVHFHVLAPPGAARGAWEADQGAEISRFVHEQVTAWRGSISAEHGIGQMKREEFLRLADPVRLAMMRAIKQALDPQGLLNPGKLL